MWSNYIKDIKILWGAYFKFFFKRPNAVSNCVHVARHTPKSRCTSTGFVTAEQKVPYVLGLKSTPQIKMIKLVYRPVYKRGCKTIILRNLIKCLIVCNAFRR